MMILILLILVIAVIGVVIFVIHGAKTAEQEKYYDAAYKIIKEELLNEAISNKKPNTSNSSKMMIYLKWNDGEKQGYVFDPVKTVRIGRDPEKNEICIRDNTVSYSHCILYVYQNRIVLKDLNSRNGTRIQRGFGKHFIKGQEYVYSGDQILVGDLKIKLTIFMFDTSIL